MAALVLVMTLVLPVVANATSVQTGEGSFNCYATGDYTGCAAASVGTAVPQIDSSTRDSCIATTRPFGDSLILADLPCVRLFQAVAPGTGLAGKNVFATITISVPSDLKGAIFTIQAVLKGAQTGTVKEIHQLVANVPATRTLSFEDVNKINVILLCTVKSSSTLLLPQDCVQNTEELPAGKSYTVGWQIEDPPGASALSISSELLVAFVAVASLPTAVALYLAKARRGRTD